MELRQLRYFVAVAEELHFGRAAERLHIVQPAVSQQIRRLEAELSAPLFTRSTRRVALTPAGRALLPEARRVLAATQRAADAVAAHAQARPLRLGTSSGLGTRLPALLAALRERLPERPAELVRLAAPARLDAVAAGELDAAFVRGVDAHPGVRLEPVWTEPLHAALPAGHALAREPVDLSALARLPLLLGDSAGALGDAILGACRRAGAEPERRPAPPNDQDLLAAIAGGEPSWTVYHAAQARMLAGGAPGVAFVALADVPITTLLALPLASGVEADALLAAARAT